jgi:hypothetical protein
MNLNAAAATNIVYFVQPGDTANSVAAALLNQTPNGGSSLVSYNSLTDDNGAPLDPGASLSEYSEIDIPAVWLTAAAAASYGVSGAGIAGTAATGSSSNALLYVGIAIVLYMVLSERKGK